MPVLFPIQALRFAGGNGDITTKIAPPYDVLDEGPKQTLLGRDENNIVAVDLPVTPPKTVGPDSAYEQAGEQFRQWIETGVLQRDAQPAVYAYEQQYDADGQTFRRRGLFAALQVQPFNQPHGIWAHEKTFRSGTDDRFKLMTATQAQLSPIFGIYDDAQGKVLDTLGDSFDREPDFFGITENDSVTHRCWIVNDAAKVEALQSFFAASDVFIADGHHRYTTALNYATAHPDQPAAQGCLFVLVAMQDPGMIVLPYHRVLCGLKDFSVARLAEKEAGQGRIQLVRCDGSLEQAAQTLPGAGHHAVALVDPSDDSIWLCTTCDADPLAAAMNDRAECWRTLDAAVLQHFLVEQVLQPDFADDPISYKYTAKVDEVRTLSQAEPGRLGVLVQATPLESVMAVSRADEVMPAKSTYFHPKLATGMVVNQLTG